MNYIDEVILNVKENNPNEPEFLQTVTEVLHSIRPALERNEVLYKKYAILERLTEPDRVLSFRVTWKDDNNQTQVNKGYRVQFNNAIGPYKGGLRFHPSVNLSIMKFLAFEQIFKNSLTTLPMGGAKGGSNFNPASKSDNEIMNFCQAFMNELYKYIGANIDVPAGDIGVGSREIGFLFGQYKKIRNAFENGVITGKDLAYGGSYIRPEATGYGCVYFLNEVLAHQNDSIVGKTFALSGFGNVAWGSAKKIIELGGKVLSLSGQDGTLIFENGMTMDAVNHMPISRKNRESKKEFAKKFGAKFIDGTKPWGMVKADIYMPCATQNEILLSDAKKAVELGVKYVVEGANMPTSNEALEYFKNNGIIVCPAKAANAGGVAVSGLEMSQNTLRLNWQAQEVDSKLKDIMKNIHTQIVTALNEYGLPYDLVIGANIAGFQKVAKAMLAQGIY